MTSSEWTVHPNRSVIGFDAPGRNGHYRPLRNVRPRLPNEACEARITLPQNLSHLADPDGCVVFAGPSWWFVLGAARTFARNHIGGSIPPPFGFKDRGKWWRWDGTISDESVLEGSAAIEHVRGYLDRLFPRSPVALSDTR